jgi:FkbM family methyltransferase
MRSAYEGLRPLRVVRNAFFSPGFRLFGVRFSKDYLQFAWHVAKSFGATTPGSLSLLGFDVRYPNQSYTMFLVSEVFVNATYAFTTGRKEPRIIDCGANIGLTTLFFKALYPDATIIAIEPNPLTHRALAHTIRHNGVKGVSLINAAVGETAGVQQLHFDPQDSGTMTASFDPAWGGASSIPVPVVQLSTLVDGPIDFLKIDIEGAEYGVIRELVESGAASHISEMAIELHTVASDPNGLAEITDALSGAGFQVERPTRDLSMRLLRARRIVH